MSGSRGELLGRRPQQSWLPASCLVLAVGTDSWGKAEGKTVVELCPSTEERCWKETTTELAACIEDRED